MGRRPLHSASILAVGSELTSGTTRDTNSGELAAELWARGVEVRWMLVLPDRLEAVRDAVVRALGESDLVVTTGGLGPTPDDLTREAIAAALGLEPAVDPALERWLRALFERRGSPMSDANLKQAWLLPGGRALRNQRGTAPGWWQDLDDGRVVVALPGPPREMRPMWRAEVLTALEARGLGDSFATETLRLTGIGESALVSLVGEAVLRAPDPEVATYARPDAVELRVSSRGPRAVERVVATVAELAAVTTPYLFARGEETWADALGRRLGGRTVAATEIGMGGSLRAALGEVQWLLLSESWAAGADGGTHGDLRRAAAEVRERVGSDLGVAVRARERDGDTAVTVAIAFAEDVTQVTRTAFLGGDEGRRRAALVACAELWRRLGETGPAGR